MAPLRRLLPWGLACIGIFALYDGWIFYARWSDKKQYERADAQAEADRARKDLALLGADSLRILSFYATPPVVKRGEAASICYGVNNATKVRIDPPVEELRPALSRCIQVKPVEDTEFTLYAVDAGGNVKSEKFVLTVAR